MAPASITKIVRKMLQAQLIQETEVQESLNRGRPAIGLILDTQSWHYLSVYIAQGNIILTLRDLSSKRVAETESPLPAVAGRPLLARIIQHIDRFFIQHQQQLRRLTAIAVTLLGVVNCQTGIVHRMPFYQVDNMPLGPELEKRTGLPVFIQHHFSAWIMAESMFGASRDANDIIQAVIDRNLGAGVITAGKLLHNGSPALVEIGHTQVDPRGKRCNCGNLGCLETVASSDSILDLATQQLKAAPDLTLLNHPVTIDTLCDAALSGDRLACDIINGVGSSLGRILAVMVNIFHPEKILIGSPLNRAQSILLPAITTCIRQQALPSCSEGLSVEATQFACRSTMAGAALVQNALYNGRLLIKLLQG